MTRRITAIKAHCPRIKLQHRVETEALVEFIARSTGLNEGPVRNVLYELRDAITFFALRGAPVKLEGLGTFTPTVNLAGQFDLVHRTDTQIKGRLNAPQAFRGAVENEEHVGKQPDDLVALWNAEHPDDPVE